MDLIKHIKALNSETEWSMWKRKIRDMVDYHEGALDAIDGKLAKPSVLAADANEWYTIDLAYGYKCNNKCCISKNVGQKYGL
ncbi:hypothetical protein GWI33_023245 [Rhynchophorus ferrugineus]|uniref:Uncharacterized protein n=1 Tax=Rhynchophorus ferrugineus TaxID=354439 RepID=A0A834ITN0_RHYFE|nr:hypothetical protein GWI33_023245 [Rhynchophorus ferrugineus]